MDVPVGVAERSGHGRDGSEHRWPDPTGTRKAGARKLRLDLAAIERSLRTVQRDFERINATLNTPRDSLSDAVLINLLAGYAYLDTLLAAGVNPLAMGNSRHLLQLNHLVLCGTDESAAKDYAVHLRETERRFYDNPGLGGVRALMETLAAHQDADVWRRAARAYIHVLSRPQLYIEGNHRTGALIMSAMLVWEGKPPFVLTVKNAKAYFDPSSLAKESRKRSLQLLLRQPGLSKRLAALLKDEADRGFLGRDPNLLLPRPYRHPKICSGYRGQELALCRLPILQHQPVVCWDIAAGEYPHHPLALEQRQVPEPVLKHDLEAAGEGGPRR